MTWIYFFRNFVNEHPLIWVVLFVTIAVISEAIAFAVTKSFKKKPAILSVIISAIITAIIAAIFNLWIGSPTINNNASIIPDNVYKTECRIVLLDYYGEYYYLPESKNKYFVNDDLKNQTAKIELINNDYDVKFEDFHVSKNEKDEIVYVFESIPVGNYTLNAYVDGYMKRSETIVFDTVEISNNYQTGEKWWNVRLVMVKNNAENTYPINVVFYNYNKHPIANLPYEFVASQNNLYSVYSYPQRTDKSGGINEILKAYDNARFWIAYINPITNAEELVCITINIDKNHNKCDIILMFDSNGKLVQTSPEQLWN